MRFRFVHAADLHLDSPLKGLSARQPHVAALFADATRRAFERLVDRTIEIGAAFLLIAGDVYDGDWKDHGTGLFFARQMARLARAGIPVALVRGNHDAESLITRSVTLPDNVLTFSARTAETHVLEPLRTALHGRSFAERGAPEDFVRHYPAPKPGWLNIGLLHTSLEGAGEHVVYAPCAVADLAARGYDYWALGHVHERRIVSTAPHIVFPGNIQGRHARETGAKGAVVVEVEDGAILTVEPFFTDVARWAHAVVDVAGVDAFDDLAPRYAAALAEVRRGAGEHPLAVRVTVRGVTALHGRLAVDRAGLAAELQGAADRVGEGLLIEKIVLETRAPAAPRETPAAAEGLDAAALLRGALDEPDLAAAVDRAIADLAGKLPEEVRAALAAEGALDRPRLLDEALDLALGRLADEAA